MPERLLDQLELGARVAQSLVADNDLSAASRHAALCWRATPAIVPRAGSARPVPAPWLPALARPMASGFSCAA